MSSSSNLDNDMQPPPKRQRILAEGTFVSPGSKKSRPISSPFHRKTASATSSSSMLPIKNLSGGGPIFTSVQEIDGCSSIESALGVPRTILFRQVGGDKKEAENSNNSKEGRRRLRPLLSRQEAEQFLRLTLLAQEIDVLVDLSETVLARRQFARRFRREVLMHQDTNDLASNDRLWKNPWLATLGPILDVLENGQPNPTIENSYASKNQHPDSQKDVLHYIHNELTRLYETLQACEVYELERAAEQNRSLVASLTDILGYTLDNDAHDNDSDNGRASAVRNLAREKLALSKLQDLLAKRVRSLLIVLCHSPTTSNIQSNRVVDNGAKRDADDYSKRSDRIERKQILFEEQSSASVDESTKSIGDNKDDDDDEPSILSLEEILIPLEVVCKEFFVEGDPKSTTTMETRSSKENNSFRDISSNKLKDNQISIFPNPTPREKKQPIPIPVQETGLDQTTNEPSELKPGISRSSQSKPPAPPDSTEDPDTMPKVALEASQRTVGAATTILTLSGNAKQDIGPHESATGQPEFWEEDSDRDATIPTEPVLSQRAAGAAVTMMQLASKTTDQDDGTESQINGDNKARNSNGTIEQYPGNDDGSFIDDPPSDGEDEYVDTNNEEEITPRKDEKKNVDIFDVVDVLTPQS